jgi:RNA recognition motif-containing protein
MFRKINNLNVEIMNIYVGNLNFKVSESELESLFGEFGTVESVKIITDKFSGRSKGFGFITMENDEEATKAMKELDGTSFQEREIVVNEAKPKRQS